MANAIGCFYVIKLTDKLEFVKLIRHQIQQHKK